MKALLDFIPLIAFFIAARYSGILAGAGALLIATIIVYAIHFIRQKGTFDKQQWVVLLLTILFLVVLYCCVMISICVGSHLLSTVSLH